MDQRLRVALAPVDEGFIVQVHEEPGKRGTNGLHGITVESEERALLRGLTLDWTGSRWRVVLTLDVRAGETPNPDGRLYRVSRPLAIGRPVYFNDRTPNPPLVQALLAIDGVLGVLLRDNTLTIERTDSADWSQIDTAVDAALRSYFLHCGHALETGKTKELQPGLETEVQRVLEEQVLPGVRADGGDIELVGIDDGVVLVRMVGACRSCPASALTLKAGVERALRDAFPEDIEAVKAV